MHQTKLIFNRALLRKRRQRATHKRGFLFEQIAQDMSERIFMVQTDFELALNLGWHGETLLAKPPKVKQWMQSDLAETMLKHTKLPAFVADEEHLPLRDQSFNLITNILTLHWVNDLPSCLTQIRRALKPDGLFLAVLFAAGTLKELRTCLLAAESELKSGAAAHMIPLADIRDLGNLLQQTGFALPVADLTKLTVRYNNLYQLLADIQMMAESQALNTVPQALSRDVLARAADIYREKFSDPDGRIRASFCFAWLSAWAPDKSQPQPLKRGSAQMSLADALKQIENKKK